MSLRDSFRGFCYIWTYLLFKGPGIGTYYEMFKGSTHRVGRRYINGSNNSRVLQMVIFFVRLVHTTGICFHIPTRVVGTIYIPPSDSMFVDWCHIMLEKASLKHRNLVIVGDLNGDFTRSMKSLITSTSGRKLQSILSQFNYMVV